jgi:hypothetical protein
MTYQLGELDEPTRCGGDWHIDVSSQALDVQRFQRGRRAVQNQKAAIDVAVLRVI